jgi:hypothetical protein
MKKTILFLMMLLGITTFGQDLRLDIYKVSKGVTSTPDATCTPKKDTLIRLEMDIVNFSGADVVFPASEITYDLCREQNVVKDLLTIQVYDKCGVLLHEHTDGSKVWDYAGNSFWKNADAGCTDLGVYTGSKYPTPSETDFGISNGCWYRTNSFPSGYQLGVSMSVFPSGLDTFYLKAFLNVGYLNQVDGNSDTATRWVIVDKDNNGFADNVAAPEKCGNFYRESAPCADITPMTNAFMKDGVLNVNGSPCTQKHVIREINFGGNYIYVDMANNAQWAFVFTGNTWTDPTALSQKELDAYAANYPMYDVKKRGKASYQYKVWDDINIPMNQPLVIRKVNY